MPNVVHRLAALPRLLSPLVYAAGACCDASPRSAVSIIAPRLAVPSGLISLCRCRWCLLCGAKSSLLCGAKSSQYCLGLSPMVIAGGACCSASPRSTAVSVHRSSSTADGGLPELRSRPFLPWCSQYCWLSSQLPPLGSILKSGNKSQCRYNRNPF